jgi:hypothetical protein
LKAGHENAIKYDHPKFSRPATSGEFAGAPKGAGDPSRGY